jgi:hypothetical protein
VAASGAVATAGSCIESLSEPGWIFEFRSILMPGNPGRHYITLLRFTFSHFLILTHGSELLETWANTGKFHSQTALQSTLTSV